MTERSPFSNFNMNFPITINGQNYTCNEQYIQSEKARLFGDHNSYAKIMASKDPREMKRLGKKIEGYVDATWKRQTNQVVMDCVRRKVYDHPRMQQHLLATGSKVIGEGTPNTHFGIGMHIGNPNVLDYNNWTGKNLMGKALMEVRSEIQLLSNLRGNETIQDHSTAPEKQSPTISTPINSQHPLPHNDLDVSPMDMDGQSDAEQITKCVLLGDSNAKGLYIEDHNFKTEMVCRSGAGLQDVSDLLEDCQSDPNNVENVVIHLGTCNWTTSAMESYDSVYRDYVEALNGVSAKYPRADLLISSIPLRNPVGPGAILIETMNEQVASLNEQLKCLAASEDNIVFIDNDEVLTQNSVPDKSLYNEFDRTGVHLNKKGLAVVSQNMTKHINEILKINSVGKWDVKA